MSETNFEIPQFEIYQNKKHNADLVQYGLATYRKYLRDNQPCAVTASRILYVWYNKTHIEDDTDTASAGGMVIEAYRNPKYRNNHPSTYTIHQLAIACGQTYAAGGQLTKTITDLLYTLSYKPGYLPVVCGTRIFSPDDFIVSELLRVAHPDILTIVE